MNTSTLDTTSSPPADSHAVCRSSELLSCARTALKIAQASPTPDTEWLSQVSPSQLALCSSEQQPQSIVLEDALSLLRQMKQSLTTLSSLVKRRGHTNDPTDEISSCMNTWQDDFKLLAELQVYPPIIQSSQHKRHYDYIKQWIDSVAAQQHSQLKEYLKLRSTILQDQAQRRKLLNPTKTKRNSVRMTQPQSSSTTLDASPLFTVTPGTSVSNTRMTNGHHSNSGAGGMARQSSLPPQPPPPAAANGSTVRSISSVSAPSSYAGGYGASSAGYASAGYGGGYGGTVAGYGGGGYGGGYPTQSTGMRQRKPTAQQQQAAQEEDMQVQIQQHQQKRQTQSRLESAQQAERKLAELGTLFGKMSSLIVQQGETLEKVEDDVEAALGDVTAGEQEIQTLYTIKKGNRALILKVFAILIFFILFMRLY